MPEQNNERKSYNYLLLTRNPHGNLRYSDRGEAGKQRKPFPTFLYHMKDFLTNNILAWIIHDWHIKKRFDYPALAENSIHDMKSVKGGEERISICIAADWATATPQAAFVGKKIGELAPDYTIHLGDTYFSGTEAELEDNFGNGRDNQEGIWPRGSVGCLALAGNHEMFSSGRGFLDMIQSGQRGFGFRVPSTGLFSGQELPFFCLQTEHWSIIGLDTGYDCLQKIWYKRFLNIHPNDLNLQLPSLLINWLQANPGILDSKKGIVLLSHHQYASAFGDEDEFTNPAKQLKRFLGNRDVVWLWGHEHRFSMYKKYQLSADHLSGFGRCIGNGSMVDEHLDERKVIPEKAISRGLELYDNRDADSFHFDDKTIEVGYCGYAQMVVKNDELEITYWSAYWNGNSNMREYNKPAFTEVWKANADNGSVTRLSSTDLTLDPVTGKSGLSFPPL